MSGRHKRRQPPADQGEGLWVSSDVMPDGSYAVVVTLEGRPRRLAGPEVDAYATTVLQAAQRAEFDAAVLRLFVEKLQLPMDVAGAFIGRDLRPDRPPLNDQVTAPFRFEPGVNPQRKPFIKLFLGDDPVGQLDLDQARRHALNVLETREAVDLDAGLLRVLRGPLGLAEDQARAVVADLANWRP